MPVFNNILAGASGQTSEAAAGYQIDRSLRFNSGDSAYLSRTPSSAGNRKTWTWSGWVKRSAGGTYQYIWGNATTAALYGFLFRFENDKIRIADWGASAVWSKVTSAVFRDYSAWYHIVISYDTTNATAADRVKLFINGSRVTDFSTDQNPTQDYDGYANTTNTDAFGRWGGQDAYYLDGYLADVHFIDGQALAATDFGEYDDNNVWQPKEYTHTVIGDNTGTISVTAAGFGSLDNVVDADDSTKGSSLNNVAGTITFGTALVGVTKVRAKTRFFGGGTAKLYNGSTEVHSVNHSADGTKYYTIYEGDPITITKYEQQMTYQGTPISDDLYALEINDTIVATSTNGGNLSSTIPASGANSFHLDFSDNTSTTTVAEDSSGNNNDWTANNISVTAGATNDSLFDSPTNYDDGTNVGGNYCTWNPLDMEESVITLSEGNLKTITTSSTGDNVRGTFGFSSGKWYWECTVTDFSGGFDIGFATPEWDLTAGDVGSVANSWSVSDSGTSKAEGTNTSAATSAFNSTGTVIGIAFDADAGSVKYFIDGTDQGVIFSGLDTSYTYMPAIYLRVATTGGIWNFGQRPYTYSAPTGYKGLCTTNLTPSDVPDGSAYFDTKLYDGTGAAQTISGLSFSPDLVWLKRRSSAESNTLFDTVRGAGKELISESTSAQYDAGTSASGSLIAFNSDGFDLGTRSSVNGSSTTNVAWTWDAGSSTDTNNTDGSITPTGVRANPSAGFSIVTYTGNGTAGATVGHGLNDAPKLILLKRRDSSSGWRVYHSAIGATKHLRLDTTAAEVTSTAYWNDTEPTSSVFSIGNNTDVNATSATFVAYCFAPVEGYSAFGSYTGNSSSDGTFIYTGFRPAFVLIKTTNTASSWYVYDSGRETYNAADTALFPNLNNAESTNTAAAVDFVSNGFKLRGNAGATNSSSNTYIYAAFGGHPFKTSRAR
jgi:hypothetical protein